jgi:hypothetical protein
VKLSTSPNRLFNRIRFAVSIMASFCVLTACNNINSNVRGPSSTLLQSDPYQDATGSFQLKSLAGDPTSPGTVIDMIGIDSQFDSFCALGTCMCEYTYVASGIGTQTVSTKALYQESNLIRCTNIVPSGTNNFDVRITVVPTTGATSATPSGTDTVSYASNSLSGSFSNGALAGSTSYMDLSNSANYVPVQRFQCRKREFIANPLNPEMIDPFQSQNPAIIYPFNYYTTNVAQSILTQQQAADQSWECTLTSTQDHTLQWWANPNVFSLSTCSTSFCNGDGALMYPQDTLTSGKIPVSNPAANGKRRSSFSLASQSYGVFQVAVQAAISPVNYVSSNYAIIGYGAKSIAGSNGTSSCPAITLPPKATWVKLWNYRATDITPGKKVTGSQSINNSAIACDTTHPAPGSHDVTQMLFPSCEITDPTGHMFGVPLDNPAINAGTSLASRVAAVIGGSSNISACYNFGTMGGGSYNTTVSIPWHSDNLGSPATYAGKDVWLPSPYKMPSTVGLDVVAGFPWNAYTNASSYAPIIMRTDIDNGNSVINQWMTNAFPAIAIPSATPMDFTSQLTTAPLSTDNYTDQIFVVTDPSVSDNDMRNNASSIQQYVPRTFRSKADCPGPASCDPISTGKTPITWGIRVQEIGTEGGVDVYPLCVLQFYD